MKTLGELLRNARQDKDLTLQEVSKTTKIEVKYLKALEENSYHLLPPPTFTKGFIRNYAQVLGKDPNELVAIYRRDFHASSKPPESPKSATPTSLNRPFLSMFSTSTIGFFLLGFLIFASYLAFQYRALLIPPPLTISQPGQNAVVTSPITLEGKTSADSLVTLNQDTDLRPDQSGHFITQINLSPGEHRLELVATNRFGRTAKREVTVTIVSSN